MTMGLGVACVIVGLVCGISAAVLARCETEPKTTENPKRTSRTCEKRSRDDERDAYYMRNFWNYDGSEQREWED